MLVLGLGSCEGTGTSAPQRPSFLRCVLGFALVYWVLAPGCLVIAQHRRACAYAPVRWAWCCGRGALVALLCLSVAVLLSWAVLCCVLCPVPVCHAPLCWWLCVCVGGCYPVASCSASLCSASLCSAFCCPVALPCCALLCVLLPVVLCLISGPVCSVRCVLSLSSLLSLFFCLSVLLLVVLLVSVFSWWISWSLFVVLFSVCLLVALWLRVD